MSEQSDLIAAAMVARDILRAVAKDRKKHGTIATTAQNACHQINAALAPFSQPPKSSQPQTDVAAFVSTLK